MSAFLALAGVSSSAGLVAVRLGNLSFAAELATGTPGVDSTPTTMPLVDLSSDGCAPLAHRHPSAALLVDRGGCSFDQKMRVASAAGASSLLVADSVAGAYASTSSPSNMSLLNPCAVDCAEGAGVVDAAGLAPPAVLAGLPGRCGRCASGACAFSGAGNASARQVCCLVDASTDMALPGSVANGTALPALFLSFSAARELRAAAHAAAASSHAAATTIRLEPPPPSLDPSSLVILLLGTATAAAAAHFGAAHQARAAARAAAAAARGAAPPAEDAGFALDAQTALGFLVMATLFLLGLYALLALGFDVVVLLLVWLFVLASVPALATLVLTPSIAFAAGCSLPRALVDALLRPLTVRLPASLGGRVDTCALELCALALAAAVGVLWYVERRAPWAWVLQDVLGATLCCSFLRTLSLPSLRVGAVLEGAMFCYDIFMVFVSPAIFHASVMMTVATAGAPKASIGAAGVCERSEGEKMPMLLLVPRLLDGGAGRYAMLGLGDVVLPGLLLAFARRLDLAAAAQAVREKAAGPEVAERGAASAARFGRRRAPPSYFALTVGGYAVGLGLALAANAFHVTVNGVEGQPALLYLVPCTLGAIVAHAARRGELGAVWAGTPLADAVSAGFDGDDGSEGAEYEEHKMLS